MAWETIGAKVLDDPLFYQDWEDVRGNVNLLRENFNCAKADIPAGVAGQSQVISDHTLAQHVSTSVVRTYCTIQDAYNRFYVNSYNDAGGNAKAYTAGYSPTVEMNLTTGDISIYGSTSVAADANIDLELLLRWDESDDQWECKKDLNLEANNLITTGDFRNGVTANNATLLEILTHRNCAKAAIPAGVAGEPQSISNYTLAHFYTDGTCQPYAYVDYNNTRFGVNTYYDMGTKAYRAGYSPFIGFNNTSGDIVLYGTTSVAEDDPVSFDLLLQWDESDDQWECKKKLNLEANDLITTGDFRNGTAANNASLLEILTHRNCSKAAIPAGVAGEPQSISNYTLAHKYAAGITRPFAFVSDAYVTFGVNKYWENGHKAFIGGYSPYINFNSSSGSWSINSTTSVAASTLIVPTPTIDYVKSNDELTANCLLRSTENMSTVSSSSNAQGHLKSITGAIGATTWTIPAEIRSGTWIIYLRWFGRLTVLEIENNIITNKFRIRRWNTADFQIDETSYSSPTLTSFHYTKAGAGNWTAGTAIAFTSFRAFKINN